MKRKVVLLDIDRTLFDTDVFKESGLQTHSIYDEVLEVLEELSKEALLGIFSQGQLDLQTTKLIKTGIHGHFQKNYMHIVVDKSEAMPAVFEKYKNDRVFFVDDKLTALHEAKKSYPWLFVIWVKRGKYAMLQKPIKGFKPDATVKDLRNIVHIVRGN